MGRLDRQLAALATMSPAQLRDEWVATFGADAPAIPTSLIQRAIAYRLQQLTLGGLPAAAQRMLDVIARDPDAPAPEPELQVKPGTRLMREWNGKVHAVVVTDDGVLFEDKRYTSLSHVAREITGAHWSGPRFFGLKRRSNPAPYRGQAHG